MVARVQLGAFAAGAVIDLEDLVIEHCGASMRWTGSTTSWEGQRGSGWELTTARFACRCGASLAATVRVPS